MALHVIVGAGPIGSATALQLAERGEQVRIVTRSGGGPEHPAVERVAADATDADRLTELATGAAALYNCASPLYYRWFTDWPPLAAALLTTAERTGAVYAVMSNLYGYDASQGPISESTPSSPPTPSSACARRCGRPSGPRTRPGGSARWRSARATTSRPTASSPSLSAPRCWPANAPTRRPPWTSRTAGPRSTTWRSC
ncbi:NAD-dependent epimerase/dehydratase family protein [Streptacidiphilus monticola]